MEDEYWYKGHGEPYWAERLGISREETVRLLRRGADLERMALQKEGVLSED